MSAFTASLPRVESSYSDRELGHANVVDREAAAVRGECSIPPACGVFYYEVEVMDRGVKG